MPTAVVRERNNERARRAYEAHKARLEPYLADGCVRCGSHRALTFHHHLGVKNHNVTAMRGYSWERVLEELALTEVLCQSCHLKEHRG
jgi:hypothetical protein